jgi:hypothetical protein
MTLAEYNNCMFENDHFFQVLFRAITIFVAKGFWLLLFQDEGTATSK